MKLSPRRLRLLGLLLVIVALGAAGTAAWIRSILTASLPPLDGEFALAGIGAPVAIERDALGVPTIRGADQLDVTRGLGFVHGQDRFFQMDLSRRFAAGELSALIGPDAVPRDRLSRLHGFRGLAQTVFGQLSATERALLDAYAEGVNAGLASLDHAPFEYTVLRSEPQPWKPEDCILINYAMVLDLQDTTGDYEQTLAAIRDALGTEALEFFAPLQGPDDAALDGSFQPLPPPPPLRLVAPGGNRELAWSDLDDREFSPGSNHFGLTGGRTASAAAMLASDMHLSHAVPNIWYRASLSWGEHTVTGVTLPGAPVVVAGSNGHVAWGFTNSNADTSDVVMIDVNNLAPEMFYNRGMDLLEFEIRREVIEVRGADPVIAESRWTVWGPVIAQTRNERPLALKWVMHDPAAANYRLHEMATARTVDEAIGIAHASGIPAQNILIAGRNGELAWTIAGRLPQRRGHDGRLPVSWSYGDRGWDGLLPPEEVPVARAAPDGHLWTANNRVMGGEALDALGDGGYESAARARHIRDALQLIGTDESRRARPQDLLALQLNDEARWLDRWQSLLLRVLDDEAVSDHEARRQLRELVQNWEGHASVDSVSYRLVRGWRTVVSRRALGPIFASCLDWYQNFSYGSLRYEPALWVLVTEQPPNLLSPAHLDWNSLLLAAADELMEELAEQGIDPAEATWGKHNIVRIRHPLSRALPGVLARYLDMPAEPLPGDNHMPRVQRPGSGASQRMVIEPGHEQDAIFHMPTGQSGHPLSPFYRAGHDAWARGEPTPLLPGPALHTLTLRP